MASNRTVAFGTARRLLGKQCPACKQRGTKNPGMIRVRVTNVDGNWGITEEIYCTRDNPCGYRRTVRPW